MNQGKEEIRKAKDYRMKIGLQTFTSKLNKGSEMERNTITESVCHGLQNLDETELKFGEHDSLICPAQTSNPMSRCYRPERNNPEVPLTPARADRDVESLRNWRGSNDIGSLNNGRHMIQLLPRMSQTGKQESVVEYGKSDDEKKVLQNVAWMLHYKKPTKSYRRQTNHYQQTWPPFDHQTAQSKHLRRSHEDKKVLPKHTLVSMRVPTELHQSQRDLKDHSQEGKSPGVLHTSSGYAKGSTTAVQGQQQVSKRPRERFSEFNQQQARNRNKPPLHDSIANRKASIQSPLSLSKSQARPRRKPKRPIHAALARRSFHSRLRSRELMNSFLSPESLLSPRAYSHNSQNAQEASGSYREEKDFTSPLREQNSQEGKTSRRRGTSSISESRNLLLQGSELTFAAALRGSPKGSQMWRKEAGDREGSSQREKSGNAFIFSFGVPRLRPRPRLKATRVKREDRASKQIKMQRHSRESQRMSPLSQQRVQESAQKGESPSSWSQDGKIIFSPSVKWYLGTTSQSKWVQEKDRTDVAGYTGGRRTTSVAQLSSSCEGFGSSGDSNSPPIGSSGFRVGKGRGRGSKTNGKERGQGAAPTRPLSLSTIYSSLSQATKQSKGDSNDLEESRSRGKPKPRSRVSRRSLSQQSLDLAPLYYHLLPRMLPHHSSSETTRIETPTDQQLILQGQGKNPLKTATTSTSTQHFPPLLAPSYFARLPQAGDFDQREPYIVTSQTSHIGDTAPRPSKSPRRAGEGGSEKSLSGPRSQTQQRPHHQENIITTPQSSGFALPPPPSKQGFLGLDAKGRPRLSKGQRSRRIPAAKYQRGAIQAHGLDYQQPNYPEVTPIGPTHGNAGMAWWSGATSGTGSSSADPVGMRWLLSGTGIVAVGSEEGSTITANRAASPEDRGSKVIGGQKKSGKLSRKDREKDRWKEMGKDRGKGRAKGRSMSF